MNVTAWIALLVVTTVIAAILGALIGHLRAQRRITDLHVENAALTARLAAAEASAAEKTQILQAAREELANAFTSLSREALRHNSDEFLKLAQENLKQFQVQAQGDLTQKEKAIENLLSPIKEALTKTEQQIHVIEKERKEAYGAINRHLETMAQTQQMLHGETKNLVNALRRPEVRGQWGELTLRRLAELSGMIEHCDFDTQAHRQTDDGAIRPDMVIRLPGRRAIVVDAKTPLDAYLTVMESTDDETAKQGLKKHAQNVRARVKELSAKSYWTQFDESPDFVVLFIPGDQFLSSALDVDRTLLEDALGQKVILATPTSLIALLRAVAYGWQQEKITENAEQIRSIGAELYKRLATMSSHFAKMGKQLRGAVDSYNQTLGSLERSVLPGARRLTELGITAPKPLTASEEITQLARFPNAAEPTQSEPDARAQDLPPKSVSE